MSFADAAIRLPGVLASPRFGLFLRFFLNPTELTITKDPQYAERQIPGWRAPQKWWVSGSEKFITFQLFWDKSQSRNTGGVNLFTPPIPEVGLRDIIAVVESFLEPKKPADVAELKDLPKAVKDLLSSPDAFLPPPEAFFVYGSRIFKCRVLSAPIRETNHDRVLNPTQIEVDFRLGVIEEGVFHSIRSKEREGLALTASGLAGADFLPELVGELLPAFPSVVGFASGQIIAATTALI